MVTPRIRITNTHMPARDLEVLDWIIYEGEARQVGAILEGLGVALIHGTVLSIVPLAENDNVIRLGVTVTS